MISALIIGALCLEPKPGNWHEANFIELQEHWVMDVTPPKYKNLEYIFGYADARLIRLLGSRDYEARQLVYEILQKRDDIFQLLVWGTRHRDPQIAANCTGLLVKKYFTCGNCHGKGYQTDTFPCLQCGGAGHVRGK